MTRKQALLRAIDALSADPSNLEAVQTLNEMVEALPITHWTDAAVRDAVEQYIEDHGHPPRPEDFRTKNLPPITAIKRIYRTTVGQWLDANYPSPKVDHTKEIIQYHKTQTNLFIQEYQRIKPSSREDYDKKRCPGAASGQTIMIYNKTSKWTELLQRLGLPKYGRSRDTHNAHFIVDIYHDFDPADDRFSFLDKL